MKENKQYFILPGRSVVSYIAAGLNFSLGSLCNHDDDGNKDVTNLHN